MDTLDNCFGNVSVAERPIYLGVVMIVIVLEQYPAFDPTDQAVTVERVLCVPTAPRYGLCVCQRSWAYVG